ncbi:unnamed protein product, partial [Closterium sp. NIES-54]
WTCQPGCSSAMPCCASPTAPPTALPLPLPPLPPRRLLTRLPPTPRSPPTPTPSPSHPPPSAATCPSLHLLPPAEPRAQLRRCRWHGTAVVGSTPRWTPMPL